MTSRRHRWQHAWRPAVTLLPRRERRTLITVPDEPIYFPSAAVDGWFTYTRWSWLGLTLAEWSRSATLAEIKAVHADPDYYGRITVIAVRAANRRERRSDA